MKLEMLFDPNVQSSLQNINKTSKTCEYFQLLLYFKMYMEIFVNNMNLLSEAYGYLVVYF